jgi:SAM-dependent methyltransferase
MQSDNLSFGRFVLPDKLHRRLQFDRWSVTEFIRSKGLAHLRGAFVLDAGSGSLDEQTSRESLKDARLHTMDIAQRTGLTYIGDLHRMPVRTETYDVVFCTQVLEHVRQPHVVCSEIFRVLKHGGNLFVTVPQTWYLHDLPHHYFNHTCYGLRFILEAAGFEILTLEPQGGHFHCLGTQLHYTCTVIKDAMTTPLRRVLLFPLLVVCSIVFGLMTKLLCLWLDRFDKQRKNTLGWNCHCRKPL